MQDEKKPSVRVRTHNVKTHAINSESINLSNPQFSSQVNKNLLFSLPPLSLYVHVPWCIKKCPYCDFNSHKLITELPEKNFLDALRKDLEQALPLIWGRQIVSVFIGGGTPSLLSEQAIDEMLSMFRAYLNIWPETEITLEANPQTVEYQKFKEYSSSGITRISIGVQSFNDNHLAALGRVHDSKQANLAIQVAQKYFDNVNVDLMYGLPNQSIEECIQDLNNALEYATNHLSIYQLSIEPNTYFAKYPPILPDEDNISEMQEAISDITNLRGFNRYEISAYGRGKYRAIHNVNYWEFGDYLGIGPGAHSKISFPDKIIRQVRIRNPEAWIQAAVRSDLSHISNDYHIKPNEFAFEFMLNTLRLKEGVPLAYYFERTGQSLNSINHKLQKARALGLLVNDPITLKATTLGWNFLNDLQSIFLPE